MSHVTFQELNKCVSSCKKCSFACTMGGFCARLLRWIHLVTGPSLPGCSSVDFDSLNIEQVKRQIDPSCSQIPNPSQLMSCIHHFLFWGEYKALNVISCTVCVSSFVRYIETYDRTHEILNTFNSLDEAMIWSAKPRAISSFPTIFII